MGRSRCRSRCRSGCSGARSRRRHRPAGSCARSAHSPAGSRLRPAGRRPSCRSAWCRSAPAIRPRPACRPAGRTGSSPCGDAPAGRRPALPRSRHRCGGAPGSRSQDRPPRALRPPAPQTGPPGHNRGSLLLQARPLPDRTPAHRWWCSSCRRGCARIYRR